MKECTSCGKEKPLESYYRNKTRKDGRLEECKSCWKKRDKDTYKNKDRRKLQIKARDANKSAARHGVEGKVTTEQLMELFNERDWTCHYCGIYSKGAGEMTLDHVEPMANGGSNTIDNCVPACYACNIAKGTKTVQEFLVSINRGAEV